jgi:hypothetical protein
MLIRFFRSSQPGLLFIVPVIVLLWFIPFAFKPAESFIEMPKHAMPLYEWLAKVIAKLPFIAQLSVSWILISIQAIYLNQLIIKHEIFPRLSFLPALFFVTLSVLFPEMQRIQPSLFTNLILLIVLDKIFMMYKNPEPFREVFDSAFLLGVATLIHSSAIVFYFFLLLALIVLLPFYWRVWVISLVGFILPFYFISVYFFWTDQLGLFWNLKIHASFSFIKILSLQFNSASTVLLGFVLCILIFSIRSVARHFYKSIIRTRKYFQLIFMLLIMGAVSMLLTQHISFEGMLALLIPITVLMAYNFLQIKKIVLAELFYVLLLGLIILVRFT